MIKHFSIKEAERYSGIKAHTLRIWEKRYGLFLPERKNGFARNYRLDQICTLLHISLLYRNGFRISKLAKELPACLERMAGGLSAKEPRLQMTCHQLICSMFSRDIETFESILDQCLNTWGVDVTIQDVIIPFLEKTDILSYKCSSCEVHFAVTAVRKKIILGIERVQYPLPQPKKALLFLPKGEHFDLLLLYMAYLLKSRGLTILYLGTNISLENLEMIALEKKPDYLYTYLPPPYYYKAEALSDFLQRSLPGMTLFIAGDQEQTDLATCPANVRFFHYRDLLQTLLPVPQQTEPFSHSHS